LALGVLMLDGGLFFRVAVAASVGYWVGILLIYLRHGDLLTEIDRKFVTRGLWWLAFSAYAVVGLVGLF
jgi:hypothetical protein